MRLEILKALSGFFLIALSVAARADFSSIAGEGDYHFFSPATFLNKGDSKSGAKFQSMLQTRVVPRLREARSQFKFLSNACRNESKALSCELARQRLKKVHKELESDELVRGGLITPTSIKDCIYAAMVTCSLLGGPDPAEQGVTPLSSLAGKELTMPLEHSRKEASENGAGKSRR